MISLTCFKNYDILGQRGIELNEGVVYLAGRAYPKLFDAKKAVIQTV